MLTEFVIDGGNAVDPAVWMAKLAEVGIACELDPTFDMYAMEGFLRVRWQRGKQPAIDVGFDFCLGFPAKNVSAENFEKVVGRYERMLANLRVSKLPPSFAEAMAEKVVELRARTHPQYVRVRVESKNSRPGDYAAAAMCSAAYAAVSGGTFDDRSVGGHFDGAVALDAMVKSKWLDMPGENVPFTTWESDEDDAKKPAKKPAAKKPAAKKPAKKPATKKPATKKPATKKPAKQIVRR